MEEGRLGRWEGNGVWEWSGCRGCSTVGAGEYYGDGMGREGEGRRNGEYL